MPHQPQTVPTPPIIPLPAVSPTLPCKVGTCCCGFRERRGRPSTCTRSFQRGALAPERSFTQPLGSWSHSALVQRCDLGKGEIQVSAEVSAPSTGQVSLRTISLFHLNSDFLKKSSW